MLASFGVQPFQSRPTADRRQDQGGQFREDAFENVIDMPAQIALSTNDERPKLSLLTMLSFTQANQCDSGVQRARYTHCQACGTKLAKQSASHCRHVYPMAAFSAIG